MKWEFPKIPFIENSILTYVPYSTDKIQSPPVQSLRITLEWITVKLKGKKHQIDMVPYQYRINNFHSNISGVRYVRINYLYGTETIRVSKVKETKILLDVCCIIYLLQKYAQIIILIFSHVMSLFNSVEADGYVNLIQC